MIEPGLGHRSIRIPRLLRIVEGREAVLDALRELGDGSTACCLAVHTGPGSRTGYGAAVVADAAASGFRVSECVVDANTDEAVAEVTARIDRERPDFVLGIGGGRVVDVAKLASAQRDVEFVSVPTQPSSDGMCSPVAVIAAADGRPRSLGARIPTGVIVDMGILASAPLVSWRSGLGDLVSNLSAVRDWRLAAEREGEEIDDFACLTSEAAALSVVEDDADLSDPAYRHKLIRGLILSGVAMEMAGSSRPASGSEHLISHALDRMLPEPRLHGLQVAVATVAAYVLRGDPHQALVRFYRLVGLPVVPGDVGVTAEQFLAAIRSGPETRPGRWTILDCITDADVARLREVYGTEGGSRPA